MDIAQEQRNGDDFVAVSDEEDVEYELDGDQSSQRVISNVDSAGNEIKHSVDRDSSAGKLFVGGVSWETTEETFTKHFMKYGEITDSVIMKEKHTKRPRGFGFVTFADPSVVDMVLEDEHVINGRMVEVKRTVPREDMQDKGVPKTKKIFVGGIPPTLAEDELKEYFSSYGNIVEHQIMLDHSTGRSRGFGFITFESEDSVVDIFSEGKVHELRGKQVEIKKAEPKRGGVDQVSDFRSGYGGGYRSGGGGAARSYGGFGSGYGGGYKSGGGYSGRTGGGYGGYGGYAESYGIGPASVYGGYGGYGYGYGMYGAGFGGSIYGPSGYGGDGYGSTGAYGGAYGGGGNKGYGNVNAANGRYHPYGR